MAVPMTPSAAGDIADLSPSTFSYPWQLPTSMASLFLWSLKIRDKDWSPVSTTPAINFFAGVVDTAEQFIIGVVDTGDKQ
jgi:hypothetical protein